MLLNSSNLQTFGCLLKAFFFSKNFLPTILLRSKDAGPVLPFQLSALNLLPTMYIYILKVLFQIFLPCTLQFVCGSHFIFNAPLLHLPFCTFSKLFICINGKCTFAYILYVYHEGTRREDVFHTLFIFMYETNYLIEKVLHNYLNRV